MIGNVFLNMDLEINLKNVVIDAPNAVRNTFIGGQYNDQSRSGPCAIDATAGGGNIFENANIAGPASLCGTTGMTLYGDDSIAANPAIPPPGTAFTNTTGMSESVTVWGPALSYVCVNGTCPTAAANSVLQEVLNPGDSIAVTYDPTNTNAAGAVQVSWAWRALR